MGSKRFQWVAGVWLACAACCCVQAQSDVEPPPDAEPPAPADAAQAQRAELDARHKATREELKTVRDGALRYRMLSTMSQELARAGRLADSYRINEEIVADASIPPGRRSLVASDLALRLVLTGERARSRSAIGRAKDLARQASPAELEELPNEPTYHFHHAEAEIARRADNRHEVALARMREVAELAWSNFNDAALSERRRRAAANELLDNVQFLVLLMVQNNRPQEALSFVTEIKQRIASYPGLSARLSQLGSIQTGEAIALCSHDNYEAALAASDASIATYQRAGVAAHDIGLGLARRVRLMIALSLGRIRDYGDDNARVEQGRAINPAFGGAYPEAEAESMRMAGRGDWKSASSRIASQIALNARIQGSESPFTKYMGAMRLLYLLNDPAEPVAESTLARFIADLAGGDSDWADARFRGSYMEDGALAETIDYLMRQSARTPGAAALAFQASEILRNGASQGSLADGAARLAAADPALRSLIEQEQLLRFERSTGRRTFALAAARAERLTNQGSADELVAKRQAAQVEDRKKALDESNAKLIALRRQIAAQFPVYRELVSPGIPTPAQLGAALRPGEAYLGLYPGLKAGYAFVVLPQGRLHAQRLAITREQTRTLVAALRKGFDAGQPPQSEGELAGFDFVASHELFKAWIAPLAPALQGTHTIYVAAGGALGNVPWAALATKPATGLADASWWAVEVSLAQMPSASALVLARSRAGRTASRPFIAFADPAFDPQAIATATGSADLRKVRQRAMGSADPTTAFDYRRVARLPETLEEAQALAMSLGAGTAGVIHGSAATRSRVLKEDLSDVRVVAFATHGLVPGELPGVLKSGLAMAYEGRGLADSLLTIDEIVGLRLNADWVILSACNTGLATGNAGDALSALMRGFFASGARTVLATQWAVESQSAKELMVATFKALAGDTRLSKALSQAQRDMAAGRNGALYRHPYFWAPYFLAGDAAR